VGLLAVVAALASAVPAGATFVSVERTFGDLVVPRVRSGTLTIPRNQAAGRVRVIVSLPLAPLAASYGRSFAAQTGARRLNVSSAASRAHLARIEASQRTAAAQLHDAIPEARIGRRFQVVLNGLTVTLPVTKLPRLAGLGFVRKIYPSLRYELATDTSPGVIGADELHAVTGARGDGIKIAVVDDGVDNTNPFLNPDGFSYPAGFPKGARKWTTPKVIVARAFPGPNAGTPGTWAVDRSASFHATHVAGIAAGDSGTCSPGGRDHPATCGLSGVAPRAYIGNYRVFNVPTPIGHVANTPEIAAAFESAVRDGMDVINFSGGGAETEPANDAMIEVIRNVSEAGVVPVISAGNDRDDFGMGSVGSPGTAPDAITVAAVSNTHVFAPVLAVRTPGAPESVRRIPIASAGGTRFPAGFSFTTRRLVDVGSLTSGGAPVDPRLCGPDDDTNNETKSPLAAGSLSGAIALVSRGHCTFVSKAIRAARAGAIGIVVVDNRAGGPGSIPIALPIPAGMITDLDGAQLRAYLATTRGTADVTISNVIERVANGRSGVVTSFSGGGPTAFEHLLKPDVSAPGGSILSSTLPEFTDGSPFAVFDGTSMSSPHVAGSAALLVQLHPDWGPQQIKSALVSTAGTAWADTAQTQEAPVTLGGAGLVDLPRATDPLVLTEPASLSFQDLNVNRGSDSEALLVRVSDSAGGAGVWQVQVKAQESTAGATVSAPPEIVVPAGGEADLAAIVRASSAAAAGENYGFILLRRGAVTRKIPYEFFVGRPQLELLQPRQLKKFQLGDTINGTSRVSTYCCPAAPFGPPPDYNVGPTMEETGAETLYVTSIDKPVANLGVAVETASAGSLIDPWFLGSPNERDVQGYAGTPVNVNNLMFDFLVNIGAAGASFPKVQRFYVSVDSGSDAFTHRSLPGRYILRSWVNDVRPPRITLLTKRVAAGRPTLAARVTDAGAGVEPLSLVIAYRGVLVGAALYDPDSGIALFPLPRAAAKVRVGRTRAVLSGSDFQEAKNVSSVGDDIMPNTAFKAATIRGVTGPAVSWVSPGDHQCVDRNAGLLVVAGSTKPIRTVRFLADGKQVAIDKKGDSDVFTGTWRTASASKGRHVLTARATDSAERTFSATLGVRVCR
jgi:minor extracellular serine protease Vpr